MQNILYDRYYNIGERKEEEKYLIQTRSQSKSSVITSPAAYGVDNGINPSVKPEKKQIIIPVTVATEVKTPTQNKPRIGQGRAGLRRKVNISTPPHPSKPTLVTNKPMLQKHINATQPQTSLALGIFQYHKWIWMTVKTKIN